MPDHDPQMTPRYRPKELGSPSPGEYASLNAASVIYRIAHDEQLSCEHEEYRIWLIRHELEKLWDAAQEDLLAERRERPGLRGWLARRLDL